MRLVHLSDLHLGYRQYQRLTPRGINQREFDVARTFKLAIDRIIELRPDVIIIAGDIFHTARPTNTAILHAFQQFANLRRQLPEAAIVLTAGNHDTPRSTETGSILGLFETLDIRVASVGPQRFLFEDLDLAVLAVPDVPGGLPELTPDGNARQNVLVLHGDVTDVVPRYYAELDRAPLQLTTSQLGLSRWDYVALGHYHVHRKIATNAFYSGSLDYTSLNVWFDLSEEDDHGVKGKGIVEYDLANQRHVFHTIPRSRDFHDLGPIKARDMTPAEVNTAIERIVGKVKGGIDDKIVRLVIRDIPRQVGRELDQRAIREYKRRALSFHLDLRKPEQTRRDSAGAPSVRRSVTEVVREHLSQWELSADLDRAQLVALGLKYLGEADAFVSATVGVTDLEA